MESKIRSSLVTDQMESSLALHSFAILLMWHQKMEILESARNKPEAHSYQGRSLSKISIFGATSAKCKKWRAFSLSIQSPLPQLSKMVS